MATKKYVDESGLSYFTQQLDVKYVDNDELEIAVDVIENELNSLDENKVGFDDYATSSEAGVVKTSDSISMNQNHQIGIVPATDNNIKEGINQNNPITPNKQDQAAFYGLAKAAGDTTQSQSSNAVGTYTDEAKAAIQIMLDIPSADDIPEVPVQDVQVNGASILNNGVANVPIADSSTFGVVKVSNNGVNLNSVNILQIVPSSINTIKSGSENYNPIVPTTQHASTFYGLAKAAGDTTQSQSNNAVGTYTTEAKTAIRDMLDAIGDVQIDGTSVVTNGIANIPMASNSNLGVVKTLAVNGVETASNGNLTISKATASDIKEGTSQRKPIVPELQYVSTFYGLSKAAGVDMASSNNVVGTYTTQAQDAIKNMLGVEEEKVDITDPNDDGNISITSTSNANNINNVADNYSTNSTYFIGDYCLYNGILYKCNTAINTAEAWTPAHWTQVQVTDEIESLVNDVQINGTSIIENGIANIPKASSSTLGVVIPSYGLFISTIDGKLYINRALEDGIKQGVNEYNPITPRYQHNSVFYGLTKAAGIDMSSSNNTVGTYTNEAKAAIKSMIGVDDVATDIAISDITPVITAISNTRYICGEVLSLSFTPSSTGICEVIFQSGSTPTVLTLPQTVKMPEWFDLTSLEANRIYEINIINGIYGAVMSWPV